ncbi:MAG TPA: hypothetical protein VHA37_01480, partial [Candidatus Saccharimonadales bacterium]|nr:hypothetical protein [Candidatus Saccharimonadales bacterium]
MSELAVAPGALDRLVRTDPWQVTNFILSSSIVRESVKSAGEVLMVLPERGAMPIYWAADGHPTADSPIGRDGVLPLPIGSFDFETPDHELRKGS